MAVFVRHEACPSCGSRDNLAVYDDGGGWCFGCGHIVRSSISGFVKETMLVEEQTWSLPDDLTQDFPQEVLSFIKPFELTIEELIKYEYYFSRRAGRLWRLFNTESNQRLCRPARGSCCSAEYRQIHSSTRGPKSRFFGSKEEAFAVAGTEHGNHKLVLVEDSMSSLKVGRVVSSAPLFGTSLTMNKLTGYAKDYQQVVVWLDRDKFQEAWEIALKFKWLGVATKVVLTQHDPKYYSEKDINEFTRMV